MGRLQRSDSTCKRAVFLQIFSQGDLTDRSHFSMGQLHLKVEPKAPSPCFSSRFRVFENCFS